MKDRIKMKKNIYESTIEHSELISLIGLAKAEDIAEAMYDAYLDTTDYENDKVEDFLAEIKNFKNGLYGKALETASLCIANSSEILTGLFVADFKGQATLTYSFTKKAYQNQGLAKILINACENELIKLGYKDLYVYINLENIPAFNLFESLGFQEIPI